MIPQAIYIVLTIISLTVSAVKHGEEKPEEIREYNFGSALFAKIILFIILWQGGFFDVFLK